MPDFFLAAPPAPPKGKSDPFIDWSRFVADVSAPSRPSWTPPEAFVCILFAAATCDGEFAAEEREEILAIVRRSRALKTLGEAQIDALIASALKRLNAGRDDALASACAALSAEMRPSAFAHALDLVLCDGELKPVEASFLNALVARLGLEREFVERIAEVIVLKNRY